MKNSRYTWIVVLRIILITFNCFVLIWFFLLTHHPVTILFLFILLVCQVISLILYYNRINRDLANFLVFLQENDVSLAFSKQRIDRNFKGLTDQLKKINQKLQDARTDRERQFHYLQAVLGQVDTGIIAFDQNGKVEIFNRAAQKLLGIRSLKQIRTLGELCPELGGYLSLTGKPGRDPVRVSAGMNKPVLAVKAGTLKFGDQMIRLVSFQDIKHELEAGELDAWRKLIRIQRHEIINSITPITTLTTAIKRGFMNGRKRKSQHEITKEIIEDALKSIEVIEDRSRGLIDFVERFRSLTNVPELKPVDFPLKELLSRIAILFSGEMNSGDILFSYRMEPENLKVRADKELMEQVLINLVKNSIEAIHHAGGKINIWASSDPAGNCVIQVTDNGVGIDQATLESIFIPSFTTKENGSGIGLSISRQIIQMHRGNLNVMSNPGVETVFEIVLPV